MGRAFLGMMAVFAQHYVDNLGALTADNKRKRAQTGRWNGAVPFGYSVAWRKDGGDGIRTRGLG